MPPLRLILLMGVSGSGKTTLGTALAARLGWPFDDADDFHPAANIAQMRRGLALSDADRAPWLAALRQHLARRFARGECSVLACSALKKRYRQQLLGELGAAAGRANRRASAPRLVEASSAIEGGAFGLVCLHGSRELLAARLAARTHAFMPPSLLDSQLAALEVPDSRETYFALGGRAPAPPPLVLDIAQAPTALDALVDPICQHFALRP